MSPEIEKLYNPSLDIYILSNGISSKNQTFGIRAILLTLFVMRIVTYALDFALTYQVQKEPTIAAIERSKAPFTLISLLPLTKGVIIASTGMCRRMGMMWICGVGSQFPVHRVILGCGDAV
jgi:hypothetical protein